MACAFIYIGLLDQTSSQTCGWKSIEKLMFNEFIVTKHIQVKTFPTLPEA